MSAPTIAHPGTALFSSRLSTFDKSKYRGLTFNGYQWGAYDAETDLHTFQRGDYRTGFLVMECTTAMIENGDAEFMTAHGLSYNPKMDHR